MGSVSAQLNKLSVLVVCRCMPMHTASYKLNILFVLVFYLSTDRSLKQSSTTGAGHSRGQAERSRPFGQIVLTDSRMFISWMNRFPSTDLNSVQKHLTVSLNDWENTRRRLCRRLCRRLIWSYGMWTSNLLFTQRQTQPQIDRLKKSVFRRRAIAYVRITLSAFK